MQRRRLRKEGNERDKQMLNTRFGSESKEKVELTERLYPHIDRRRVRISRCGEYPALSSANALDQ